MAYSVKIIRPVGRPTRTEKAVVGWSVDVGNWIIKWLSTPKGPHKSPRIASGKAVSSLEVAVLKKEGVIELSGSDHLGFALQGRKKGKYPPVIAIKNWIRDKRIVPDGITLNQLAFLIGRKIAESGTDEPKLRPQNLALIINKFGNKHLDVLGTELAEDLSEAIFNSWVERDYSISDELSI